MREILLSEYTFEQFVAFSVLSMIGAALNFFMETTKRKPHKEGSPTVFSWTHLIKDNIGRLGLTVLFVYVWMMFRADLIGFIPEDSTVRAVIDSNIMYVIIGGGLDYISAFIKKIIKQKVKS